MKLADRHFVEGTSPAMYIGRRSWKDSQTGRLRVSKRWVAEWNLDGKKFYEKLRTNNKQVAIRRAHEICQRIARGEAPAPASVTIEDLVKEYVDNFRGQDRRPKTLTKYEDVLERFVEFTKKEKIETARQFDETSFWRYSKTLIARELAPKTRHNYLVIVKQLWRWAARVRRIAANPVEACKVPDPPEKIQPCPTAEHVGMLLAEADGHLRPIIAFLAFTGARFGEAAQLQWPDLELDSGHHGFVRFSRGGGAGTTKSGRIRRVPLHPEIRQVLDGLAKHPNSPLVFHAGTSEKHPDGSGAIDERRTLRSFKRLCKKCNVPDAERLTLHSLRHFFASSLARRHVSYKYALEFLGHSSSRILDIYYAMFDPDAEEAILAVQVVQPPLKEAQKAA